MIESLESSMKNLRKTAAVADKWKRGIALSMKRKLSSSEAALAQTKASGDQTLQDKAQELDRMHALLVQAHEVIVP